MIIQKISLFAILGLLVGCTSNEDSRSTEKSEVRDSVQIVLAAHDSLTAYELLAEAHEVAAKETAMGVFVSMIDSVENFSGGYWLYSVNDTSPKIAADKLITNPGDTVKWHFRLIGQ